VKYQQMSAELSSWEEAVAWLRNQPDQADLVRVCFYDDPLLAAAERYYASTEWAAVCKLLAGRRGMALDLGAGRGISAYALARDGWNVTALEPDPSVVVGAGAIRALAREANLNIRVEQEWGESLPFPDASFDLVLGRQVLHHARDLRLLCREAARVLMPGGLFIATREHVISRHEDLQAFLDAHPLQKIYGGENAYLLSEYKRAIIMAGIRLDALLNPYQSDINLYPETTLSLKRRLARKFHLPQVLIPDFLPTLIGAMSHAPGRLYTFVGHKDG
jgi:SAM-dependent methyltransferase